MLFGSFMATGSEDQPLYAQVEGYDVLRKALDAKLAEYNESNASMDLVLFQQVTCQPSMFTQMHLKALRAKG